MIFEILHSLHHMQFVKEYLKKVRSGVKISDGKLEKLFGSVVER